MPDDKINTLINALYTLTEVVLDMAQKARPEHLSFLEKDLIQQRLSGVTASLEALKSSKLDKSDKLDDPSLS